MHKKFHNIPIQYQTIGDIELSEEEATLINQQITDAEQELKQAHVHFRWSMKQLVIVKQEDIEHESRGH